MRIPFYKYQATANDFIIINQMMVPYLTMPEPELIANWCDRRLGIGADGLMIIAPSDIADFKMIYYNSDGRLSTMCGNGGRAISHMAHSLKMAGKNLTFEAVDGLHEAKINGEQVALKMIDVRGVESDGDAFILDTGSPHFVAFQERIQEMDIVKDARLIRYNTRFAEEGINVNYVESQGDGINVRTYERGVEDETYSCGTGVTAAAIAAVIVKKLGNGDHQISITTKGGNLSVTFSKQEDQYTDVWLIGPAVKVFEGNLEWDI